MSPIMAADRWTSPDWPLTSSTGLGSANRNETGWRSGLRMPSCRVNAAVIDRTSCCALYTSPKFLLQVMSSWTFRIHDLKRAAPGLLRISIAVASRVDRESH